MTKEIVIAKAAIAVLLISTAVGAWRGHRDNSGDDLGLVGGAIVGFGRALGAEFVVFLAYAGLYFLFS